MPTWKPHSLAHPHANQLDLDRGAHVAAIVDLNGVPAGTHGRVMLANGFNWLRYRVRFDNEVELGDLDARHIEPTGRTAKKIERAKKKAQ
jgi:hypothetical protein